MTRHRDTNLKWTGMVKSILLFFIGLGVTTASKDQSLISNECKLPYGNSLIPGSEIEIKSFPFLARIASFFICLLSIDSLHYIFTPAIDIQGVS